MEKSYAYENIHYVLSATILGLPEADYLKA